MRFINMLSFENDYNKGAHPKILEALIKTNDVVLSGYGEDEYTKSAKEKIKNYIYDRIIGWQSTGFANQG